MGRQLYATQPTFRRTLDQCAALFDAHLPRPLLAVIFAARRLRPPGAAR
jgi:acyl transferase domain-containing protein